MIILSGTYTWAIKWGINFLEQIYVRCLPFQSCLCAADSLNYAEERRQIWFEACLMYRESYKRDFTLHLQCCCGVLWSSVTSCRPDLWLKLPGFSYTPCTSPTSSPPHMCLFHPRLVLYHLKPRQKKTWDTTCVGKWHPNSVTLQNSWTLAHWVKSLNHDTLYLRAHRSHNCTCPGSPGWWRKAPLPRPHPPILWPAPSCISLPEWRLADPCALQSHLDNKTRSV